VADHTVVSPILAALLTSAKPNEHPLMPAIRWARQEIENVRKIQDYSAIMVKRERIGGQLSEEEYAFVKIRHRPFSVYMRFLYPPSIGGQEVIWIEGANDGKMWARGTGLKRVFGTVSLSPTSPIVMRNNRYPITEIGILRLVERIIEVAEHDAQYGECEVTYYPGARINNRPCLCIQVVHPIPRANFRFHIARVFVDEELRLPVRYESYDWPKEPGGSPLLLEEYTYLNIRLNNGFTDKDFDINNPEYGFTGKK
jgi:outer membrane lipoprotein-sorting protein